MVLIAMMSTGFLYIAGAFLFFSHFAFSSNTCYAPDGKTTATEKFLPCIGFENVNSMCCRLNDTSPDTCLEKGLCQWNGGDSYWRGYCTDKTWDSPNCLNKDICGAKAGGTDTKHSRLVLCRGSSGNTYCCGSSADCCDGDSTFTLNSTLITFNSPTATSTTTASAIEKPKQASSSSEKVAIGAGVGVPLGVLAILMLGVGFWWGRRHSWVKQGSGKFQQVPTQGTSFHQADSRPVNELDSSAKPHGSYELSANGNSLT